jgi:hypothetical protein
VNRALNPTVKINSPRAEAARLVDWSVVSVERSRRGPKFGHGSAHFVPTNTQAIVNGGNYANDGLVGHQMANSAEYSIIAPQLLRVWNPGLCAQHTSKLLAQPSPGSASTRE